MIFWRAKTRWCLLWVIQKHWWVWPLYVRRWRINFNAQGLVLFDQGVYTRPQPSIADGTLAGVFSPSLDNLVSNEQVLQAYLGIGQIWQLSGLQTIGAPEGQFTLSLPGLDGPRVICNRLDVGVGRIKF